ncbi:hypothetical protein CENSYa_0944 [Cenarchaeum symbiosum A]|uniref:Uncharacterized protein n=1 Tax=Cenarchaeum symbiosum (strain A) TaxID=414004 RepID=A0RW59_CENSY|nr:hypothetical protein CENSYa_0944 [Cenarchaeum symbiosum A]
MRAAWAILLLAAPFAVFAVPGEVMVDLEGEAVAISYDAVGLEVRDAVIDRDATSVIFEVEVTGTPGMLTITMEREFLDAIEDGEDVDFVVIADAEVTDHEEVSTDDGSRVLQIELSAGIEDVEVIGRVFAMLDAGPEPRTEDAEPVDAEEPGDAADEDPEDVEVDEPADASVREPRTGTDGRDDMEGAGPETEELEDAGAAETRDDSDQGREAMADPRESACGPGTVLQDGVCVLELSCGAGTVLQDGVCVLDEACGPGTILRDGVCVLDNVRTPSGSGLGVGFIGGIMIALFVAVILWVISKIARDRSDGPHVYP